MDPARAQNTDIAGKTYPEALRDYLRESFGMTTIDVVNRGYSGEDSRGVQTRWTTNPNADLHIIMLGSNDATRSIPVDEYLSNMYKLVNNIISWGSAVILLTPPKHSTETSVDISLKSMAEGLYALGKVLGVPVINSKRFLEGIPYLEHHPVSGSTLLDAIHYNSYGYSVFASKVAALIVGRVNLFDVKHLTPGNHLFVDKSRYGFTQSGADNTTQLYSSISPIGIADSNAKGIYANVTPGNSLTYSFYAEENDLVLVPIHQFAQTTNASVEYSLNYGLKQARPLNSGVDNNQTQANATDITPTITFTNHQNLASGNPYLLSKQLIGSKLLRVTQKGWHTLIIRNTSTNVNAHCYILGTEVLSLRSLKNYDVAAPTTGTWVKGSIVWNSNPVAAPASPIGWVCTSSGTPGTWYQFGLVGATRMTKQVSSAATDVPTLQADFNALLDKLKAGGWMDA
jgi:lysophospholipase L1-like esterase